jgi:hypothetical protein
VIIALFNNVIMAYAGGLAGYERFLESISQVFDIANKYVVMLALNIKNPVA